MLAGFDQTAAFGVFLAGISTGVGALPIYLKKQLNSSHLNFGLGLSAGVMLVASFVSLIQPGLESGELIFGKGNAFVFGMMSLVVGYLAIIFIHDFFPHEHLVKDSDMERKAGISKTTLIVLAIALHNIPEGLAVGVGFGSGEATDGMALALAISLQNMPEGLVVAFGLLSEGASRNKAFGMALLSGLIEPLAAFLGYFSATVSTYSLPLTLCFAGGMMLFVICQEILPELFFKTHSTKVASAGVISGIVIMLTLDYFI